AVWSAATWALQTATVLPFVRHHRVASPYALTLPVASALYGAMTLSSALRHALGRGVAWKGRTYRRASGRRGRAVLASPPPKGDRP
ncbi:MAG: hypothetical protein R3244_13775, partial [Thermoanaerobaculia bacterium]|nr:hypothetical protein [Thermoanaerobaculia bacterium]